MVPFFLYKTTDNQLLASTAKRCNLEIASIKDIRRELSQKKKMRDGLLKVKEGYFLFDKQTENYERVFHD